MSFINSKLGNGFRIKTADSSKDQEHYFTGAKKFIEMNVENALINPSNYMLAMTGTDAHCNITGLAVNSTGTYFACGYFTPTPLSTSIDWMVLRSTNDGLNWTRVDHFRTGSSTNICAAQGIVIDSQDRVYVAGYSARLNTTVVASGSHWVVRKSSDLGTTWSTVDVMLTGAAMGIGIHPTNDAILYVVGGSGSGPSGFAPGASNVSSSFVVRRTANNGTSWTTVDNVKVTGSTGFVVGATCVAVSSSGKVFVTGQVGMGSGSFRPVNLNAWVVRSSSDGTSDWGYAEISASGYHARGIAIDRSGTIWVVGGAQYGTNNFGDDAYIKKSTTGITGSWTTSLYIPSSGTNGRHFMERIIVGPNDELYAIGEVRNATTSRSYLQVRRSDDHGVTWSHMENSLWKGTLAAASSSGDFANIFAESLNGSAIYEFLHDLGLFYGAGLNKWGNLIVGGFSGTATPTGSAFVKEYENTLSASIQHLGSASVAFSLYGPLTKVSLYPYVRDAYRVPYGPDEASKFFSLTSSNVTGEQYNAHVAFVVSGSTGINLNHFYVEIANQATNTWKRLSLSLLAPSGTSGYYFCESNRIDSTNLTLGQNAAPPLRFMRNSPHLRIVVSGTTSRYAFNDVELRFDQKISDAGVVEYKEVENQYNQRIYKNINMSVLKKIT